MNIDKDVFDAAVAALFPADKSDLTKIKQVLESSGFSDEQLDPVMQVLDQRLADLEAGQNELDTILARKDVKDHIQSKIDASLKEKDTKIKEVKDSLTEVTKTLTQTLVDSCVSYSLILHKDGLDFENLDSSIKSLTEELSSKPITELNDTLSELQGEFLDTFKKNPSATIQDPVSRQDNGNHSQDGGGDDPKTPKSVEINTVGDVIKSFFLSAAPEQGSRQEKSSNKNT